MDDHVPFWRAATNEEDEIYCNPLSRAADRADIRLERRQSRMKAKQEARRKWGWTA